jgi:site-specific DNA recombinase
LSSHTEEMNRLNRERRASGEGHRSELAKIRRTLKQMLSAIAESGHTRGMTERMRELEAREDVLKGLLAS